jgi:hypothetical protein
MLATAIVLAPGRKCLKSGTKNHVWETREEDFRKKERRERA